MALTQEEAADLREEARDPYFFVRDVLHMDLDWYHSAALRLAVEHPFSLCEMWRGGGKSFIRTTGLCCSEICNDPDTRILILSETEEQAIALLAGVRNRLETDPLLEALYGKFTAGRGKWTDTKLMISQRRANWDEPTITAMGIGGPATGRHYKLIILDDIFDVETCRSETLRELVMTLIRSKISPLLLPGGRVVMNCTRYDYEDPAGCIEREFAIDRKTGESCVYRLEHLDDVAAIFAGMPRDTTWKVLQIPAILRDGSATCPVRFPIEDRVEPDGTIVQGLTSRRAVMLERHFGEQYLMTCREQKNGERGTVFDVSKFTPWERAPDPTKLRLVMHHDPAWTSREVAAKRTTRDRKPDFTAISVLGVDPVSRVWYVLDHHRDLLSDLEAIEKASEIARAWKAKGLRRYRVERTGLQMVHAPAFYGRIRAAMPVPVEFVNPQKNKVAHAEPFALAVQERRVLWNPAIFEKLPDLKECFDLFPSKGIPDDDVDSISGAFLMGERSARGLGAHARQPKPGEARAGGEDTAETDRRAGRGGSASAWAARVKGGSDAGAGDRWAARVAGR